MIQRLQEQPWSYLAVLFCTIFGPWTAWFRVLLILIVLDYATGFMKGCVTGTADSDLARKGIFRKLGSLMAVALAHQIDVFTGTDNSLTTSVLALLIATEAWSNMENLDDIGVPLPPGFKEVVGRLRENNPRKIGGKNGRNSGQK